MFQKILVALDGSKHSLKALEIAVQITKEFNGKMTLIHVYSVGVTPISMPETATLPPSIPVASTAEISKMIADIRETSAKVLAEGKERAKNEGVEAETLLKEGHVVHEIVKAATEGKFDLIVMGARGLSMIKELLLGSVSDGVIRNAPCPVLVTK